MRAAEGLFQVYRTSSNKDRSLADGSMSHLLCWVYNKKKSSTNPQQTGISWDYLTLKAWSQFCRQIWQTCQLKTAILWLCKGVKAGSELLHQALLFKIIYSFVWVQLIFWTGDTWCNSNGAHVVRWEPISNLFIDVEWLNSQWSQLFQCTHAI